MSVSAVIPGLQAVSHYASVAHDIHVYKTSLIQFH